MRASASIAAWRSGLRARLSAIAGYGETITKVGVRINLAQSALGR